MVRDEGDKETMSLKAVAEKGIKSQKELSFKIEDVNKAGQLLELLGCKKKSYQETKRELWRLGEAEITIDEWPFLEPLLEVEGKSEKSVKLACAKLGMDYSKALFCAVGEVYSKKYGLSEDTINNKTPKIVFKMKNPFMKKR